MSKSALPDTVNAALILADGTVFWGRGIGKKGQTGGEICFNTGMTGYQEVLTDPSYAGQIITFTFPHIGIVGANAEDIEATQPHARGLVVREDLTEHSNWRADNSLQTWLETNEMIGIAGVDTRAITRHIRLHGAQNAMIIHAESAADIDLSAACESLTDLPSMKGQELAATVTSKESYGWTQTAWTLEAEGYGEQTSPTHHVVAIDYGEKLNILRLLATYGCKVTVVPAKTSAADILALKPDGVFLSNGPGDPAATGEYALPVLRELMDKNIPIFGICLGHQLLALAVGARTEKMPQGHRGANHPVKRLSDNQVEITSQNHGFMVVADSLPANAELTHVSLFDGTVEGFKLNDKPMFAVQYHPESSPGPHDSRYLFADFISMMNTNKQKMAS